MTTRFEGDIKVVNITLDTHRCLFSNDELDLEDSLFLERSGYQYAEFVPIGKTQKEGFYIRKNTRESLAHTFLVHNIKQHLEKYTDDIQVRLTMKPDIVFTNKHGERVALEIETGKYFRRHKERIKEKFARAKKYYPKVYIVLTSTKMKAYYRRLLPDIPLLVRTDISQFLPTQFKQRK